MNKKSFAIKAITLSLVALMTFGNAASKQTRAPLKRSSSSGAADADKKEPNDHSHKKTVIITSAP